MGHCAMSMFTLSFSNNIEDMKKFLEITEALNRPVKQVIVTELGSSIFKVKGVYETDAGASGILYRMFFKYIYKNDSIAA